jgi:hypothetical protein
MNKVNIFAGNTPVLIGLGVLAAIVLAGSLGRFKLPLISSERGAFFALVVIGFAMCTLGMQFERYGWAHPASIAGIILGSLALIVVAAVLFRLRLPLLTDERAATIALTAIMAAKVVVGAIR